MSGSGHFDHEYSLRLAFDSDDPEFARGFEAGRLDALLQANHGDALAYIWPMSGVIHATNAEMAMRMAEVHGLKFTARDLDDAFVEVTFSKADSAEASDA